MLANSEVAVIAVPTPLDEYRQPDLSFVKLAAEILGKSLTSNCLIINESTSYPGTLSKVIAPIINSHKPNEIKHLFAISPERVDPGNRKWNIRNTPRLFAGLTEEATVATREFYSKFCDDLVPVSSPEIAESAKLFENTFRQVNIALVNEFALIMRALEIPVHEVLEAASTKPYGIMKFTPGLGVGGHCIPVDPSYLAFVSKEAGIEPRFINLANQVNLEMPQAILKRIKNIVLKISHILQKSLNFLNQSFIWYRSICHPIIRKSLIMYLNNFTISTLGILFCSYKLFWREKYFIDRKNKTLHTITLIKKLD
jgi:UDP-N-acetyl-D-glucosamine dehydrogenase